jgi:O-antigen ligase
MALALPAAAVGRLRGPVRWEVRLDAPWLGLALVAVGAAVVGMMVPLSGAGALALLAPILLGAAAVIFVRPDVGLPIVFLAAPLETLFWEAVGVRVKPYQMVGVVVMLGWAAQVLVGRRLPRGSSVALPLALIVGGQVATFVLHLEHLSFGISLFILQLWFAAAVLLLANFADEPALLRRCFWALVLAGSLEAVYGLTQAAGFYRESGNMATYQAILLDGRSYGTFTEPDFLGGFLAGCFLLVVPFWARAKPGSMPILLGVPILAAGVLCMVRASWLGVLAGLLVFGAVRLRGRAARVTGAPVRGLVTVLVAVLATVAVIAWLSPPAVSAVMTRAKNIVTIVEPENPHATRLREVQGATVAVREAPLVGHGIGTYGLYTRYGHDVAEDVGRERGGVVGSGTPLGLLFDQGIPGLAFFILFMGAVFWRLWRALAVADGEQAPYLQAMLVSLAGLVVSSLFNNMYYFGFLWLEIALAVALAEGLMRDPGGGPAAARVAEQGDRSGSNDGSG